MVLNWLLVHNFLWVFLSQFVAAGFAFSIASQCFSDKYGFHEYAAAHRWSSNTLPWYLFLKLATKWNMHSLHLAPRNTSPTPAITACPTSVHMVKPLGHPIASLRWLMNQIQFSVVSESKTQKQIGYNHLCPSTTHALANCPLYLPVKNVLSIARYGLQPARNPSMHGFNAKKIFKLWSYHLPCRFNASSLPSYTLL